MSRMPTYVALALGGGALIALLGEHSVSTYAYAQVPTGALPQVRNSELLLAASPSSPVTTPTIPLGVAQQLTVLKQRVDADEADVATLKTKLAADDKNIKTLQSQVSTLQSQVAALQGGAQGQLASLQKLQAQFANHYHTYTVTTPGNDKGYGAWVTFHCPGMGQSCTANFSLPSINGDFGMIVYPFPLSPRQGQTYTVSTSGPKTN
jgi:hypothetical protein